jgi:FKBP-type peptidyl-prolyl cis-trans isomerase SlyD
VALHEEGGAEAAEQRQGRVDVHELRQFSPMQVSPQCVVALTWTLKDSLGEELDVLEEPVEFLVGGGDLLTRVEEALQGHEPGDRLDLHLEPEDAFGDYDGQQVFLEPRGIFPAELEEGMVFEALPPGHSGKAPAGQMYTVTEIYPEHVVLDANHPLAGIALRLHLKVEAVREATEDEIGAGTVGTGFFRVGGMHGPGSPSLH